MVECNKVNVKLSDSQLNKFKKSAKDPAGVILRINITNFNGNNLPQELLLTKRRKIKLRKGFENDTSPNIKLT